MPFLASAEPASPDLSGFTKSSIGLAGVSPSTDMADDDPSTKAHRVPSSCSTNFVIATGCGNTSCPDNSTHTLSPTRNIFMTAARY